MAEGKESLEFLDTLYELAQTDDSCTKDKRDVCSRCWYKLVANSSSVSACTAHNQHDDLTMLFYFAECAQETAKRSTKPNRSFQALLSLQIDHPSEDSGRMRTLRNRAAVQTWTTVRTVVLDTIKSNTHRCLRVQLHVHLYYIFLLHFHFGAGLETHTCELAKCTLKFQFC